MVNLQKKIDGEHVETVTVGLMPKVPTTTSLLNNPLRYNKQKHSLKDEEVVKKLIILSIEAVLFHLENPFLITRFHIRNSKNVRRYKFRKPCFNSISLLGSMTMHLLHA